jgi:cysteinyl-tRNA synthetase
MATPSLELYDTMTAKVVRLAPKREGEVRVYCCGPTPYDVAHAGHARAAIAPDILVRHLRSQGLQVTYVRNITDVEDKILARARELGEEPTTLSARFTKSYQEDIRALGCDAPTVEPKVSEHIPEIIALIEKLIARGVAYEVTMPSGARDVYYAVRSFAGYGKLSKRNIDDLRVGARIEASDDKRDPLDFALWKGCVDDAWGWDSPWGKGRPGWHIECSAMSARYLGHGFDIHTGGMDLVFPHHENEIAQSEGACPDEGAFASIWMHNGFVNIDKEKMSKSLGNFVTIKQIYERNDPEAFRYFLLGVQYRGPIQFDTEKLESGRVVFPGVIEAEKRVDYLYQTVARLEAIATEVTPDKIIAKELTAALNLARDAKKRMNKALDEDLNTPVALGVIADLAKAANEICDLVGKRKKDESLQRNSGGVARELLAALRACFEPLGMLQTPGDAYRDRTQARRLGLLGRTAAWVEERLADRTAAREAKDFPRSDAIRAELSALEIEVADGASGSTWRVGAI